MNVVLDTNIVREDFLMNSSKFYILFDYLKKTNSKIKMTKIVYQEIAMVYERELANRLEKFGKAKRILESALIDSSIQDLNIAIANEVEKYLTFLKRKFRISDKDIVPYKDSYLKEVVERAIRRIKPCSEKGEEFRDALLWLTVLDIARKTDQKMLIFISNNVKQFASDDGCLHPSLLKEAENEGLTIKYYNSMSHFIKDHATKIDYITYEWLVSAINLDTINKHVTDMLEKLGEERLLKWAEQRRKETTGYVNPISSFMDIDEFYVYEMTDGSLYVETLCDGEVEVEFEFKEEVEEDSWNYEYEFDHIEGDFEFQPVFRSRSKTKTITKCLYPEIQVTIGITIKNKEVKNFEIIDWDFM